MSKYFKYAIGEILLVMIGILLALQVNNWNTERLLKLEEILILENLKEEFKENQSTLNATMDKRQVQLNSINNYQKNTFNKDGEPNFMVMDSLIALSRFIPTFESRNGVLQEVLNSGKLNIIHNKVLRKSLSNWSAELDDLKKKEISFEQVILSNFNPYIIENYQLRHSDFIILNELFQDDPNISTNWSPEFSKFNVDKMKLFNDVKFESLISLINLWAVSAQRTARELSKKIEETIFLIETELKNN